VSIPGLVWLSVALFGVLGMMIGSYLNVVIYRLPRGLSTVTPRSRCPQCESPIRALDNLPVLSFASLGGRCRVCRTPISWRYPLTELAAGLLFALSLLHFGPRPATLVAALFCCLMLVLGEIDGEHMILPDRITYPGIALGLALQPLFGGARLAPWDRYGLWGAALGATAGAAILLAIWAGWYLLRREEGMGLGDVKMLALVGAFLGWQGVAITLFFASLLGAVVGLGLLAAQRSASLKTQLPFGVFLALAGLLALFFGEPIIHFYAHLLVPG
jgi:leader peptidase (prepilin peptidase) / N-methyltransferase